MIPRILKNFNLFVNGVGYAGLVEEAEIPAIKLKMDEHRVGGMDGVFEIEMGQEAMSSKLTMAEHNEDLILALATRTRFQLRGSIQRDTSGQTTAVVVEMQGKVKTWTPGGMKAGDPGKPEHEIAVDYFRFNMGGVDLMEIDVENMVRKIGGVDQLAAIRADIAI